MKISAAFPSKYLKASDLQDRNVSVIMSHVELEDVGDVERKPVLHFEGKNKGLVLNKTNSRVIAGAYSDDTDAWAGKPLVLFPAMVDFRGDSVEAIRVKGRRPVRLRRSRLYGKKRKIRRPISMTKSRSDPRNRGDRGDAQSAGTGYSEGRICASGRPAGAWRLRISSREWRLALARRGLDHEGPRRPRRGPGHHRRQGRPRLWVGAQGAGRPRKVAPSRHRATLLQPAGRGPIDTLCRPDGVPAVVGASMLGPGHPNRSKNTRPS
jgi:hypothetical protein